MNKEIASSWALDCESIEDECLAEGYPGKGVNYWARVEDLGKLYMNWYGINPCTGEEAEG